MPARLPERFSFSRIPPAHDLPDLIAIQRDSFNWFLNEGIDEVFQEISPIEDVTGQLILMLADHTFGEPAATVEECKSQDKTYGRPLTVMGRFLNRHTGEIKEEKIYLGDFPMMTPKGVFVINGTERVIVSQLVRSPGVYFNRTADKNSDAYFYSAKVIPGRGAWLEMDTDRKNTIGVRVDRKRRQYMSSFLRAIGVKVPGTDRVIETDEEILEIFGGAESVKNTLERDTVPPNRDAALIDLYRKLRPGEPASAESALGLINNWFRNPKRYDLSRVGRYKLAQKFNDEAPVEYRDVSQNGAGRNLQLLRDEDIIDTLRYVVALHAKQPAMTTHRGVEVPVLTDDIDHFGNRRVRTVGELVQNQLRIGLARLERVVKERMSTKDHHSITPRILINSRPVTAAIMEFFGTSQLSQFMDQPNALAGLTHRRRLSALGPGGLSRERAGFEVRDVHPSHYGRMCPIETPEGPNIGLIGSLATYARVNQYGFIETPYRKVEDSRVLDTVDYLAATEEERFVIAQANTPIDEDGSFVNETVLVRRAGGEVDRVPSSEVHYMDVSPKQIVSLSTSLIPFLEHDDANRALMGSNMQRQAVPLLRSEAPLVGTGMEEVAARDSGDMVVSPVDGEISEITGQEVVVREQNGKLHNLKLDKFTRSNQGTCINHKPVIGEGDPVAKGDLLADGSSTQQGELALGKNLLVAFMPWQGYNFEDAIVLSERLVKHDILTSIHIEQLETEARETKLGDEEITRDIPNVPDEVLAHLDESGIIRVGAEVSPNDYLVGKVTPKGETELTPEERLLRAIFGEKAREVRDSSLKVKHGQGGKVIDVKVLRRADGENLKSGVNEQVRVYVAQQRKISEGDKLAGRHGNKGVIAKILPEEDMPFLADGTPVDIVLSPLGVPSRMNLGQVMETHLGWVAAAGWKNYSEPDSPLPSEGDPWTRLATPVFDGAREQEILKLLRGVKPNSDGKKLIDRTGKATLYDGRTGEAFDKPITVGYIYMLKLVHLVDDKIHARSTGPYSLITQQPLGGKAQFGGQRFGEMEVWALEAYGAAYALQEFLTIKSDDVRGRIRVYEAIVRGDNPPEPGVPESFRVLVKEMQSLGLSVEMLSSGERVDLRETDEDAYRTTSMLDGIDISRPERPEEASPTSSYLM
ncbi:MAG: DNA-directed RNA polymerase subunit beta [Actinomycetia bacterium]|nr:DNA-directed RNA polymerase subunit beta [Actinomycetes bacterium]